MVKEIIILRDSGIPLFHYSVGGEKKLDELVAGFLSAVGFFAEQVGESKIKVISFANSKFVWEKTGDLYFIALVSDDDSSEIYRVILRTLSDQFVSTYYSELRKDEPLLKNFRPFTDTVELTLQKFDGIPGLARRYKTVLLPVDELRKLKDGVAEVEKQSVVFRAALVTNDGYIVVSNFRAYELEGILDILVIFGNDENIQKESMIAVHTSLDPRTQYFLMRVDGFGVAVFVVKIGHELEGYAQKVAGFLSVVHTIDFTDMRKIEPKQDPTGFDFYEFDIVTLTKSKNETLEELKGHLVTAPESIRGDIETAVRAISRNITIDELKEKTGQTRETISEVLAYLISAGIAEVNMIFPVLEERDERFSAYLEVVGLPKREYDIINTIWKFCNGSYSVGEIAEISGTPPGKIIEVIRKLGKYVKWENQRVLLEIRR